MTISRDFQHLKNNGSASAAELNEFIQALRGKRPQEVLGLVAQSGLTRGIVTATVLTVVGVGLLTVVPYAWEQSMPAEKPAVVQKAEPAPSPPAAATPAPTEAAAATNPASAAPAASGEPSEANKNDALSRLGIDETKMADPKSNPLEDKADDLLKDLK